jgi:hypothetical protein
VSTKVEEIAKFQVEIKELFEIGGTELVKSHFAIKTHLLGRFDQIGGVSS